MTNQIHEQEEDVEKRKKKKRNKREHYKSTGEFLTSSKVIEVRFIVLTSF